MNTSVRYKIHSLLFFGILCAVVYSVYWQALFLPFIQDDWGILHFFLKQDLKVLRMVFYLKSAILYRPLAQLYLFGMYKVFGLDPRPFHIVALLVHALNAYVVFLIFERFLADKILAFATALVYAAAISIHLDTLAWVVGIYDVGGAFLFFLSILMFFSDRWVFSAVSFFCGCLFKEAVTPLPIILFLHVILFDCRNELTCIIHKKWQFFLLFIVPLSIVLIIKFGGLHDLDLSGNNAYALDLFGGHIIENFGRYLVWMFQAFSLLLPHCQHVTIFHFFALLVESGFVWACFQQGFFRHVILLHVWVVVGVLPVLFLPNHTFRYYATYSLPAFIAILLLFIKVLLCSLKIKKRIAPTVFLFISLLAVFSSMAKSKQLYGTHLTSSGELIEGTNHLVKRAAFVDIVQMSIKRDLPTIPEGSVFFLGGVDLWSFHQVNGLKCWYQKENIRLYDLKELRFYEGKPYVYSSSKKKNQSSNRKNSAIDFLDPAKIFIFKMQGDQFVRVNIYQSSSQ